MKVGLFKANSTRHDSANIIERINELSSYFRNASQKVIFIQHDGTNEAYLIPGTDNWNIVPGLLKGNDDIVVSKTANDSFYKSALQKILEKYEVNELFITGCATDFCVDATIKSALSKDYKVTVVEDAHITAARPFADAQTLINHYNWMWADMAACKYKISLVKAKEIAMAFV